MGRWSKNRRAVAKIIINTIEGTPALIYELDKGKIRPGGPIIVGIPAKGPRGDEPPPKKAKQTKKVNQQHHPVNFDKHIKVSTSAIIQNENSSQKQPQSLLVPNQTNTSQMQQIMQQQPINNTQCPTENSHFDIEVNTVEPTIFTTTTEIQQIDNNEVTNNFAKIDIESLPDIIDFEPSNILIGQTSTEELFNVEFMKQEDMFPHMNLDTMLEEDPLNGLFYSLSAEL